MKYLDLNKGLSHNKKWNLYNSIRNVGKTYTIQKHCLKRAFRKENNAIGCIFRTKTSIKEGALYESWKKVLNLEFKKEEIDISKRLIINKKTKKPIVYALALSDYMEIKKKSYPDIKRLFFDEYSIEEQVRYFKGWKEPDALLSIYDTIDRREGRVSVFMLSNNITMFNPYHVHPFFNVPTNLVEGDIYTNKNVYFEWAVPSAELLEEFKQLEFVQGIEGTSYGDMMLKGKPEEDFNDFVLKETGKFQFNIFHGGEMYGVYISKDRKYIVDYPQLKAKTYYLLKEDIKEGCTYLKPSYPGQVMKRQLIVGNVYYNNPLIKKKLEGVFKSLF